MNPTLKTTFHMFAVASVAGSLMLSVPNAGLAGWFGRDDSVQQAPVEGGLRRPVGNQSVLSEEVPAGAPIGGVYQAPAEPVATAPSPQASREKHVQKTGATFPFFKEEPRPSLAQQPRRVPAGNLAPNQNFSGEAQPDSYMQTAPVEAVETHSMKAVEMDAAPMGAMKAEAMPAPAMKTLSDTNVPNQQTVAAPDRAEARMQAEWDSAVAKEMAVSDAPLKTNIQEDLSEYGVTTKQVEESAPVQAPLPAITSRPVPERVSDNTYPKLSDVPPAPARIAEVEAKVDAQRADLEAARAESNVQRSNVNEQVAFEQEFYGETVAPYWEETAQPTATVAAPAPTPVSAPAPIMEASVDEWEVPGQAQTTAESHEIVTAAEQQAIEDEFSALVAAPQESENTPAWEAPAQPVASAQPAPQFAAPEGEWQDDWEPAPMVTPQNQVSVVAPVNEGEWVDLSAGSSNAMPVEQVSVGSISQPVSVAPVDAGVWGEGGFEIAPPPPLNAAARTLPESRYAGRHQSLEMERHSRQTRIMEYQRRAAQ